MTSNPQTASVKRACCGASALRISSLGSSAIAVWAPLAISLISHCLGVLFAFPLKPGLPLLARPRAAQIDFHQRRQTFQRQEPGVGDPRSREVQHGDRGERQEASLIPASATAVSASDRPRSECSCRMCFKPSSVTRVAERSKPIRPVDFPKCSNPGPAMRVWLRFTSTRLLSSSGFPGRRR